MKILAYYLPQFHEIEENNKWWGKGFTEWENLKRSNSLYEGHNQPKEPLNDNYYNLLEKETMLWQTKLATEYGIYGFCYYHYWFKGKKFMEKPIENLLKWKDIKQKFCLCWANHSWSKRWIGDDTILLKQEYGNRENWMEHFDYLKNFFKDERYIKKDNKPIFVIFNPTEIKEIDKMIELWNEECKKIGFEGIHVIKTLSSIKELEKNKNKEEYFLIREGTCSFNDINFFQRIERKLKTNIKKNLLNSVLRYDYRSIVSKSLKISKQYSKKNIYPGVFTGWDNTPRYGNRGYVSESTPELFKEYLIEQKKIMVERDIEYIFLNAWNEWTEGMYLEPDKKNKYIYLETVKEVVKDKNSKLSKEN